MTILSAIGKAMIGKASKEVKQQLNEINQNRAAALARLEAAVRHHTATTVSCSDRGCTIRQFGARK